MYHEGEANNYENKIREKKLTRYGKAEEFTEAGGRDVWACILDHEGNKG